MALAMKLADLSAWWMVDSWVDWMVLMLVGYWDRCAVVLLAQQMVFHSAVHLAVLKVVHLEEKKAAPMVDHLGLKLVRW
jgi:hypothetical protein